MKSAMPKNAVRRLLKIENDLKTVISIYDVSKKSMNMHDKLETEDELGSQIKPPKVLDVFYEVPEPQKPELTLPFEDFNGQSILNRELKKPKSPPFSTIRQVFDVKTNQNDSQIPVHDIDGVKNITNLTAKKIKGEKRSRRTTANKTTTEQSFVLKEYPDWLFQTTSNWFGSIKHSYNLNKDRCDTLVGVGTSKTVSPDDWDKDVKSKLLGSMQPVVKRGKFDSAKQNKNTPKNEKKTQTARNELPEMIEKSNEKLDKMKVYKKLALDIAKHLKKKYDELMDELLKVQVMN